jgi:hypothetical protein
VRSDRESCPSRLPWFAAGALDRDERAGIEEHLLRCQGCREELARWSSLGAGVRERAGDHPSAEALTDWAESGEAPPGEERGSIERHLESCADCRSDVALVRGLHPPKEGSRLALPAWGKLAAVGVVAAIGLVAVVVMVARTSSSPELHATRRVVLEDTYRSGDPSRDGPVRLMRPGPWALSFLLPEGATSGRYTLSVVDATTSETIVSISASDEAGTVDVVLDALPPGRYTARLEGDDGRSAYPFVVENEP